jgi:glyoxylase-like metal-dependent hydrolase (beta-lactamase superfamily II)
MWTMYFNPKRGSRARKQPKYQGRKGLQKLAKGVKRRHRIFGNETLLGFDDWQIIHTPGHSWDSCCFYHEDSGSLLSGDTLLGSAKQNKVVVPSIYANATQMEQSLTTLRKLNIKTVYPGHGSIITGDLHF